MTKQQGPNVTYTCWGCQFLRQDRHVDSEADEEDFEQYCDHAAGPKDRIQGDRTPKTCPFRRALELTADMQKSAVAVIESRRAVSDGPK